MEGLLSPRTSLRTLSEARFAQDGTGALLLERTTLFAEAQCTLGDRRLRLFCPLSPRAPPRGPAPPGRLFKAGNKL